jgi:uncharacterized membrane protein YcaP (DUF421 family)
MLHALWQILHTALGLDLPGRDLSAGHMALRALVIYSVTLAMMRCGARRFAGNATPLDLVLSIVLGAVLSRAITGASPFFPTIAAGATLVAIHRALAALTLRSRALARVVDGVEVPLLRHGRFLRDSMRRHHVSHADLMEALRVSGKTTYAGGVRLAQLERNGKISVIREPPRRRAPRVVEVAVEEGVKAVRIELPG